MKELTVNRIELSQDKLKIENEIGSIQSEGRRIKDRLDNLECLYKHKRSLLLLINHNPNEYLRKKRHEEHSNKFWDDLQKSSGI